MVPFVRRTKAGFMLDALLGAGGRIVMLSVSTKAFIAKEVPSSRWQAVQWQQWTNSGGSVSA